MVMHRIVHGNFPLYSLQSQGECNIRTTRLAITVVLYLAWCVNVTQPAAQKKVQCLCSPKDDFRQYQISPPTADVVNEAKDHCTTAWTCNSTECAYYDYEIPEKKDAMMFAAPVVNASFEAVDVENHVVVLVTVDCPQKGFIAKNLPCPCGQTSSSPPSNPTKQSLTEVSETAPPDTKDVPLKIVLPFVIFLIVTFFGSVAVVLIIKRKNERPERAKDSNEGQSSQHAKQSEVSSLKTTSV